MYNHPAPQSVMRSYGLSPGAKRYVYYEPYPCPLPRCSVTLMRDCDVMRHIFGIHYGTATRNYKCRIPGCEAIPIRTKSELKSHLENIHDVPGQETPRPFPSRSPYNRQFTCAPNPRTYRIISPSPDMMEDTSSRASASSYASSSSYVPSSSCASKSSSSSASSSSYSSSSSSSSSSYASPSSYAPSLVAESDSYSYSGSERVLNEDHDDYEDENEERVFPPPDEELLKGAWMLTKLSRARKEKLWQEKQQQQRHRQG